MSRGTTLVVLAVLVVASSAMAVGRPTLTVNDSWTFEIPVEGSTPVTSRSVVKTADATTIVIESNIWTNQSTPNPLGGEIVTSTQTTATQTLRASDGALEKVETRSSTSTTGLPTSGNTGTPFTTTTTYDPPCVQVVYPLTVGSKWSIDCTFSTVTSTNPTPVAGSQKADFEVKVREALTVKAGDFTAYKVVNVTGGKDNDASWYVPATCGTVKTADAAGKTTSELTAFTCATPGTDDYQAPPPVEDETPPANDTGTDDEDPAEDTGDDNMTDDTGDDDTDTTTPPAEPEKKGFLGLPSPGAFALVALLGAAALAWNRR